MQRGEPEEPTAETDGRGAIVTWLLRLLPLCAGAVSLLLFEPMARRVITGNSDGATVILEGRSMASGHLLLGGWMLSLDSFWTIDAIFNAIAVAIVGVRPELFRAVPIAIAALLVAAVVYASRRGLRRNDGLVAAATAFVLIALPGRPLGIFLLQGPYHVGTALYCLVAFLLISARPSSRRADALGITGAVVFLAAGMLGDFQTVLLGVGPLVVLGIVESIRRRTARAGFRLVGAGVASVLLALIVRMVARALGGFQATKRNPFASHGQMLRNLRQLPGEFFSFLGVTNGPFGPSGVPELLRLAHVLVAALVIGAVLAVLVQMLRSLWQPTVAKSDDAEVTSNRSLEELCVLATLADLAIFVLLPIIDSPAYGRYLTASVIFAFIVGARTAARLVRLGDRRLARLSSVGLLAVALIAGATFGYALQGRGPRLAATELASYLRSAGLTSGVGDYWSSSVTTVASDDDVRIRPVVADGSRLVRYDKQTDSSWYRGARFDFYVYVPKAIWNGDDAAIAIRTYGAPTRAVRVGEYRILIWSRPFTVNVNGSQGP